MLTARNKIRKVVVIRHGALGDVLAVRAPIRFLKDAFPSAELTLIAPGERGRLFRREGWADRVCDWERAAFSWLFAEGDDAPPAPLAAAFAGSDIVLAYQDSATPEAAARFEARLHRLAPAAGTELCPTRPHADAPMPIGEWLLRAAMGFCVRYGLWSGSTDDLSPWTDARLCIDAEPPVVADVPYMVIHPGSGSKTKNWPVHHFAELARLAMNHGDVTRLVVTSGEADGDAGTRLAEMARDATLLEGQPLEALAATLANAAQYVGNDSGVSHLAAAVHTRDGRRPRIAAIFGPSEPAVWAPPGAQVLHAGPALDALSPQTAYAQIFP